MVGSYNDQIYKYNWEWASERIFSNSPCTFREWVRSIFLSAVTSGNQHTCYAVWVTALRKSYYHTPHTRALGSREECGCLVDVDLNSSYNQILDCICRNWVPRRHKDLDYSTGYNASQSYIVVLFLYAALWHQNNVMYQRVLHVSASVLEVKQWRSPTDWYISSWQVPSVSNYEC